MVINRQPERDDLITIYDLFQDKEFMFKDLVGKLQLDIRRLTDKKIVLKVRRLNNHTWIYRLNPTIYSNIKNGKHPQLMKV